MTDITTFKNWNDGVSYMVDTLGFKKEYVEIILSRYMGYRTDKPKAVSKYLMRRMVKEIDHITYKPTRKRIGNG